MSKLKLNTKMMRTLMPWPLPSCCSPCHPWPWRRTVPAPPRRPSLLAATAAEEEEDAAPRWLTSIGFGGSLTSGNSDTLGLNLSIGSEKMTEKNEFALGLSGSYGETDSETSTEIANLFFNYKRIFDKSYIFSNTSLFHDKIALISYRFTTSLGYGRNVIDNDRTKLGLEAGVAYIHEDYEDDPTGACRPWMRTINSACAWQIPSSTGSAQRRSSGKQRSICPSSTISIATWSTPPSVSKRR